MPAPKPFTPDTLVSVRRLGGFDISPDGRWLVASMDELAADGKCYDTNLYRLDLSQPGELVPLTRSSRKKGQPRFSPDGRLGFLSQPDPQARREEPKDAKADDKDVPQQLHVMPIDGGEAVALTDLATGVAGFHWSRDGKTLLLTCPVHPSATSLEDNARVEKEWKDRKPSGRLFESYPVRFWDHHYGPKHPHLVAAASDATGARDLCVGMGLGLEESEGDLSRDGRTALWSVTRVGEGLRFEPQVFVIDTATGERRQLTNGPAQHWAPRLSPDGRRVACLTQEPRPRVTGKLDIAIVDLATGARNVVTTGLDLWPTRPHWVDDRTLAFGADEKGHHLVRTLDVESGTSRTLTTRGHASEITPSPDGKSIYFLLDGLDAPMDLWRVLVAGGAPERLTHVNREVLDGIAMTPGTSIEVSGFEGSSVQVWEVRPPGFDASRRYPFLLWIHGGPIHSYLDQFHFRWNSQIYAAAGYVVVMVNPRGSTGFGQKWIEENNGDWGNRCYRDLMAVTDHYQKAAHVDASRMAALGASFGGYMANWIAGRETRFKCLVSHAGLFHLAGFHGTTDCGPEWELEFGGIPWESPDLYDKHSPSRDAPRFTTPTLVIHGELDYRVPLGEGLQMFQALQSKKVPSKFLYFPDENHWILKPANLKLWNETVLDWLEQWMK